LPASASGEFEPTDALPLLPLSEEREYVAFMMDWSSCPAVERDPEKVSGSWVFRNTRVPVVALFENFEGGASVDDFLSWFPGVTREQVEAVIEYTIQSLKTDRQAA
ncbi:MAG: DUF433 domain-containing protein, partial [Pyrinomonadaceae bacterium]